MNNHRCLFCGRKLNSDLEDRYHQHYFCIKKFFNVSVFPDISFLESNLETLAIDELRNHLSITGVQKKISCSVKRDEKTKRLFFDTEDSEFIIKTPDKEIPDITENEHFIMQLANDIGLETVENGLIKTKNNGFLYITKRIDRVSGKKLPMEDFCQLSKKLTEYKYQGSYEKCVKEIIDKYSSRKQLDKIRFFNVIYFSYVVGNTDMHLKNFSLYDDGSGFHLAPFFDLVSSYLLVGQDEFALSLNGKRKKFTKNDFIKFGENIGLSKELSMKLMKSLNAKIDYGFKTLLPASLMSEKLDKKMEELVKERLTILHAD